ncbi:lantibiotic dehydratase [Streptomyces parvus]|uniref:lantibiotic dehydratase n=1 Tax=Streptomyces parvus TaxID=66428 RepID=UPI002100907B|nr:lantibiotic dehydratase [Streptomyces parvus]MCQ1577136.1 lantibiotic dehydratase family protein [Streptomyces parvus]
MGSRPLFRAQHGILARSVLLHDLPIPPAPDLSKATPVAAASWRRWVLEVWGVQQIAAAVRHASPDLSREIDNLKDATADAKTLRRLALALLSYTLRLTYRPTPFGLAAGITEGRFGAATDVRWGHEHRTRTRADGLWFAAVIQQLEADSGLRRRLRLCANNALCVRGERLVLPWQPRAPQETGTALREVSVRHTPAVRAAVQMTSTPVPYGDVVRKLGAEHPELSTREAEELLDLLITQRMLLTSLQPSSTETDALGYLVRELNRVGGMQHEPVTDLALALQEIHAQMRDLDQRGPVSVEADRQRAALTTRMRQIADQPSPLAVDARLDADLVIPRAVAWEVEAAAGVLARVTPEPHGTQAWLRYRERFRDRYGEGTLVPLMDLLDPHAGLGLPEDFHGTPRAPEPDTMHRDRLLVTLAQRAWADGQDLVLDEDLIQRLAHGQAPASEDLPAHVELTVSVYSASAQQLDRGEFSVAVRRSSRGWGHFSGGRLAALLAEQGSPSDLLGMLARRPTTVREALPVQVSFPSLLPRADSITRTPRLVAPLISLSEYPPAVPDLIPPSDLAVTCHQGRLHVVSLSRARVLEASIPHPLQLECQTPTIARFLDELQRGQSSRLIGTFGNLAGWDWGAARHLAFQPRVRAGRSILSPATWRLAHAGLPGPAASTAQWDKEFATLRERWRLPRHVYLERFDHLLRLDLEHPAHRALLRSHVDRPQFGQLTLAESEPADAYDWCGGRAHEVVTYLASTAPARPAPVIRSAPIVGRDHARLPGASRYLSAHLHCQPQARRALFTDHLPALASDLPHCVWWTTARDGDDRPHTELTIRLPHPTDAAEAMRLLGLWAAHLTDAGVVSDFALVPYRPHVGLWGTEDALTAAETTMSADTAVIAYQHARLRFPVSQPVLAAANLLALAAGFHQGITEGMRWLAAEPKPTTDTSLPRPLLQQARTLAAPDDGWAGLRQTPGGADLVDGPWAQRHEALATYREALRRSPHTDSDAVLRALLTAHLRHIGEAPQGTAWRLARAIALASTRPRRQPTH